MKVIDLLNYPVSFLVEEYCRRCIGIVEQINCVVNKENLSTKKHP